MILIVVFAAIGRATHSEGNPVLDSLSVAWPFLVGAALGWAFALGLLRRSPNSLASGVLIWLGSVIIGMLLRALTGQGTAVSFVVVATLVLAAFLLGWRAAARLWQRFKTA